MVISFFLAAAACDATALCDVREDIDGSAQSVSELLGEGGRGDAEGDRADPRRVHVSSRSEVADGTRNRVVDRARRNRARRRPREGTARMGGRGGAGDDEG